VLVVLATRVLVPDGDQNRCAERHALEDARKNLRAISLAPLAGDLALARPSPVKLPLDLVDRKGESRRASVNDHTDGIAVGLPPRTDPEELSKGAAHLSVLTSLLQRRGLCP